MKILSIIIVLILLTGGVLSLVAYGASRPYQATLLTAINYPLKSSYALLTNVWEYPLLLNGAMKVDLVGTNELGLPVWKETDEKNSEWLYQYLEWNGSNQVRMSLLSNSMYHYGNWVFSLSGNEKVTYIAITENSQFSNWWYYLRAMFFGRDAGLRIKINALEEKFPMP